MPILEVACGSGKLLHFLKKRGYENVSGVDVSPEKVALSKQVVPTVHEGDALEFLEAHTNKFEFIVGLDIIEHFNKDEVMRFLDGCRSAIKPGGRLVLQTPNAGSPWAAYHRYNDFTHEVCFQHNSISRLLALCGFRNTACRALGPVPLGYCATSTIRWLIWQLIRAQLKIYNLAETGTTGSGVFTCVFVASGVRE